jgi:hypothetical protein
MKNGFLPIRRNPFFILNRPEGTPQHAHGIYHFATAKYHISVRKYITFPQGKYHW